MKITVRQYYKSYASLYGLFAAIPIFPLVFHACIPDSHAIAAYLYPPLGDVQQLAFAATVGSLLLITLVVFTCCRSAQRLHPSVPVLLMIGTAFGVCVLIGLYVSYVKRISVPSVNLEVPVSIGYQRTPFALQTYPHWSDWEMLHDRGPWEEQIQKLWTPHSIGIVRALLWGSYTLTLACFLSVVSLAVYKHADEDSSRGISVPAPEAGDPPAARKEGRNAPK
jgi:hypothetical protein